LANLSQTGILSGKNFRLGARLRDKPFKRPSLPPHSFLLSFLFIFDCRHRQIAPSAPSIISRRLLLWRSLPTRNFQRAAQRQQLLSREARVNKIPCYLSPDSRSLCWLKVLVTSSFEVRDASILSAILLRACFVCQFIYHTAQVGSPSSSLVVKQVMVVVAWLFEVVLFTNSLTNNVASQ
jgi:hypothetical protein